MKELNEYTTEVRRRVEEKKRARRRTAGRIAALSAPLALLLTLTAFLLPRLMPMPGKVPDGEQEANGIDQALPVGEKLIVTVEALTEGPEARTHTLTDDAAYELKELIDGILIAETDEETCSDLAVESADMCRRITLTGADGSARTFELIGKTLKDAQTGVCFPITQAEYERLMSLISE